MAAEPPGRPSRQRVMDPAELDRILFAWNDTAAAYPSSRCVHELFEEQARKTPAAVALEHEGARMTYAELDAEASRLAHYLRSLGVGPEVRVGLCVKRSFAMVVGLLGILKACAI